MEATSHPTGPHCLLFISYSHIDRDQIKALTKQIHDICGSLALEIYSDEQLIPGHTWHASLWDKFQQADIILLAITPAFLASKNCQEEAAWAKLQHEHRGTKVVPLILHGAEGWQSLFDKFQAIDLPRLVDERSVVRGDELRFAADQIKRTISYVLQAKDERKKDASNHDKLRVDEKTPVDEKTQGNHIRRVLSISLATFLMLTLGFILLSAYHFEGMEVERVVDFRQCRIDGKKKIDIVSIEDTYYLPLRAKSYSATAVNVRSPAKVELYDPNVDANSPMQVTTTNVGDRQSHEGVLLVRERVARAKYLWVNSHSADNEGVSFVLGQSTKRIRLIVLLPPGITLSDIQGSPERQEAEFRLIRCQPGRYEFELKSLHGISRAKLLWKWNMWSGISPK